MIHFLKNLTKYLKNKFNLIISFEVLEHTINPYKSLKQMYDFLSKDGFIIFSTLLRDKSIDELGAKWWYISPRNGHVSIYAKESIQAVLKQIDAKLQIKSFNQNLHIIFTENSKNSLYYLNNFLLQ